MSVVAATFGAALREAWTNRRSFWVQVTIMVLNDAFFLTFWVLFFHKVPNVRGWDTQRVLLLFSILATVSGIAWGLFGNCRRLGEIVGSGGLDAVLTLPVDPLAYVLTRQVNTAVIGDILFGPVLFVLFGHPTPGRTAVFLLGSLCGSVVVMSFLVLLGSTALWGAGRGEPADLGFQVILMVAGYPIDVFGGFVKLLLFTAIPAAFVSGLPTELVDRFEWTRAAILVGATAAFAVAARVVFQVGLKRYRSGSAWTRA